MSVVVAAFWYQDWQYSLPAPRPAGLRQPAIGAPIELASAGYREVTGRPLMLHFFNPACPCSRFNLDHVRELIRKYEGRVSYLVVLSGDGGAAQLRSEYERLGLGIDAVVDENGEWGRLTGVYATPQAVVLDAKGGLYYRGNYNQSRYCNSPKTEYARLALDRLLAGLPAKAPEAGASVSYGCPLKRPNGARRTI